MRQVFALVFLLPACACAGTSYVVSHRTLGAPGASASVAQYFVEDGKVRAGGLDARTTYLFKDSKVYVIDNAAHSIQVVTSALVAQAADKMDQRAAKLADSATSLPPEKRAVLDKMAADMKALNDSRRVPVPRDYRRTERTETVDGHSCRIWEATEWNKKRYEFCVAAVTAVPGSSGILRGMQVLSQYWQGSIFALGVKLGNAEWWTGIAGLQGLPILIREFKDAATVSETVLSSIQDGVRGGSLFDLPQGYPSTEVSFIP